MGGVEGELLYIREGEESNNSCSGCGGKEGVARRLAILPFIPGQKYTIGTCVTSREEQGEFIFCFFDGVSRNEEGHCTISCGSGSGFFVAVVESEHSKVFLNGEKVEAGNLKKLEFGDEIKLQNNEVSNTLVLYFKRPFYGLPVSKEVNKDGDFVRYSVQQLCLSCRDRVVEERRRSCVPGSTAVGAATPTALQIGLVVQKVMDFLPFHDLKEARLVAKVWAEEGAILLKKRAQVSFDLREVWSFGCPDAPSTATKPLPLYLNQMKGFGLSSVRFVMRTEIFSDAFHQKFSDDLETFLQDVGAADHTHHLEVQLFPKQPQDFETLIRILEATSPNLRSLNVSIFTMSIRHVPNVEALENSAEMSFPNLQKLSFQFYYKRNLSSAAIERLEKWCAFVENFLKIIQAPRLTSFTIDVTDAEDVEEVCFRCLPATVTSLEVAGGVPMWWVESKQSNTLEKVKIIPKDDVIGGSDAKLFSELLKRHSRTLQNVELTVRHPAVKTKTHALLEIPAMPNLKVLKLSFVVLDREEVRNTGGVAFEEADTVFEMHLPNLQSLSITLLEIGRAGVREDLWLKYPQYIAPFFQNIHHHTPCKTLVRLDVPYFWKDKEDHHTHFTKGVDLLKLMEAFPYVVFPELDAALEDWKAKVFEDSSTGNIDAKLLKKMFLLAVSR